MLRGAAPEEEEAAAAAEAEADAAMGNEFSAKQQLQIEKNRNSVLLPEVGSAQIFYDSAAAEAESAAGPTLAFCR